jgi:hypothetical protein
VLSTPPAFVLSQDQTLHRKNRKTQTQPKTTTNKNNLSEIIQSINTQKGHQQGKTNQFIDYHTLLSSQTPHTPQPHPCGIVSGLAANAEGPSLVIAPLGLALRRVQATR